VSPSAETLGSPLRDPAPLYEHAFRRSAEAIGVTRLSDGVVLDANAAFARLLGLELFQVIGRRTVDLGVWDSPWRRLELVRELRRSGSVQDFEVVMRPRGGTRRTLMLSAHIMREFREPLLFAIGRDVTEQRATETELVQTVTVLRRIDAERRGLLSRLVTAQEEERRRIALELHDDPVQKLAAVGMRLEVLGRSLAGTPHEERVRDASETVHLTIHRMRRLMFELRPATLDRAGLVAATRELLDGMAEAGAIQVRLQSFLTCEPRVEDRILAYRIVQEALANIARHADAARVDVLMDERDDGLYIRITDDGHGFDIDTAAAETDGHLGLTAMRERAEVAGGWWRVSSAPGDGTLVESWFPRRCLDEESVPA
jgi:PAS domain S-box-containing protein